MARISGFNQAGPVYGDPVVLAPSAARATNSNGNPVNTTDYDTARLTLNVTAASGSTPSLTVNVQTSEDGSSGWATVSSFAAKTGASTERKVFSGLDRFVRASWTMSGTTPNFTFSVTGELV